MTHGVGVVPRQAYALSLCLRFTDTVYSGLHPEASVPKASQVLFIEIIVSCEKGNSSSEVGFK